MSNQALENRFMEFRLADQLYALPLLTVKEVIQKPEVISVPNMPTYFEGMINLRGQILGVFNIKKRLSSKSKDPSDVNKEVVVVIEDQGLSVGIIVDEVTRVLHTDAEHIKPAPTKEDDPAKNYVSSVIQTGDQLVLTLNVAQLLELEKFKSQKKTA